MPLCTPPSGTIFVPEASTLLSSFIMSNGVFNFNFLALVFSEILGGSQIYTRGPYAPWTPPIGEIFFTQSEYFTISNCVFNFNIVALVFFDILGGSKFTLGALCTHLRPLAEIFFVPQASTLVCLMAFLISTF